MTQNITIFSCKIAVLAGLFLTQIAYAANPLPPEQAKELSQLFQTYTSASEAAINVRKQAENLQTEIASQQSNLLTLQNKADSAEKELSELQEFDRKKPGKVKSEELDSARSKHLQAGDAVEAAKQKLTQQQTKLIQLKEDLAKKNIATEHSVSAYQTRFEALAKEAVTRRVNALKVPQQITESASIPCEDLALKECKSKTQQEVQRRAIEKGAIIVVDSLTEIKNLKLEKDEVKSEVHGEISNLKILETKLTDEPATYAMKIQATVTPVIGASLLAEINRTVSADISLQVSNTV
jgi:DNA repair exonuclease SbcCD ATPase subunit